MKSLFIVIAVFCSLSVVAQKKHVSINQTINDDGKTLSIKIKGTSDGKPVDYDRTFNVSGMTQDQKDELKQRVYDSLGIELPIPPVAPRAPIAPRASLTLTAPAIPATPAVPAEPGAPTVSARSEYSEMYAIGGEHPYTKEIRYNPKTGLLYMKYRFIKNGEETTVEKSIDAKDKSKEERDTIIKKYEREIGVAQPEII